MTVSFAEATAAARRIQEGGPLALVGASEGEYVEDALLLAAFVLAGDTERLRDELRRYKASLMAHHDISTLSETAIRESLGGPCQICARAQKRAAGSA